ncbi:hypothetical protein vec25_19 [Escherichia phage VEc25]|uniref:Uncharacterized protein n=4 Tax=Enquatrovirus N4 TaxID=10752 RepID=A0A3G3MCI5_9CAUD|nr:hypothetical protein [Escherichia phage PMBT57]AYR04202.1 hypothetical protein [Escherichia phage OLB145]QDF14917.1 hypothetical protein AC3HA13_190 [Escherichia phage vB_EcoP_3HA13]QPN96285.1 hypothetical protein vec25_19 [Escherichia phage VEc25]QXV75830.1 hypothetical protein bas69_0062 [Escherichia phage AlfredRasser]CAE6410752.1 gp19 [Escherichia phage vB_Eco_Jura]
MFKFLDLIWAVILLVATGFVYGFLLPSMMSALDSIIVVMGLIVCIVWPLIVGRIVYLTVKKRMRRKHV